MFSVKKDCRRREIYFSARKTERLKALENIMTYQITDFTKSEQTKDLPITIRLLIQHEFLPLEQEIEEVAKQQDLQTHH